MDSLPTLLEPILSPLRPTLQSLTHNLPAPFSDLAISILGSKQCYNTLIRDIIPEPTCVKLGISKGLGLGIIAASSVVKIPQLLKILKSQSASGLSFNSLALETAAYLINLAYSSRQGFPFSTYGETALIAAQNVAIAALVLQYSGKGPLAGVYVGALAVAGYALFSETLVPAGVMEKLVASAGVLGVASKVPQIVTIWQQGGTGQLSAFAVFNFLAGSIARIFTTIQEVDDPIILYGFIAGFVLNLVLAIQMVYYWNSPETATHAKEAGKTPAKIAHEPIAAATGSQTKKSPSTRRRG